MAAVLLSVVLLALQGFALYLALCRTLFFGYTLLVAATLRLPDSMPRAGDLRWVAWTWAAFWVLLQLPF